MQVSGGPYVKRDIWGRYSLGNLLSRYQQTVLFAFGSFWLRKATELLEGPHFEWLGGCAWWVFWSLWFGSHPHDVLYSTIVTMAVKVVLPKNNTSYCIQHQQIAWASAFMFSVSHCELKTSDARDLNGSIFVLFRTHHPLYQCEASMLPKRSKIVESFLRPRRSRAEEKRTKT